MHIVVGSAANHLRVEGDPTSLTDPRAPAGVRSHVRAVTTCLEATCPACSTRASRIHSTYRRTLAEFTGRPMGPSGVRQMGHLPGRPTGLLSGRPTGLHVVNVNYFCRSTTTISAGRDGG